jgi:acyl-CoA thioester hydrolase
MVSPYHFSTEVRVRLPETDAMGIAFHGHFFTYMDVGRMDYLRNLGLIEGNKPIRDVPSVVVRSSCNFKSPARFDDPLVVHVRIAEIGRTSFRFEFRIVHKKENRLVAEGESVHVAVDPSTWRPIPVAESFRAAIRGFEGSSLMERPPGPTTPGSGRHETHGTR